MTQFNFTLNTTEYNKTNIKSKLYTTQKAGYIILNNSDKKNTLNVNDYITNPECSGLYNSVILIPDTNMVLSYSPQTEVLFNTFETTYPMITPNIYVNEFIEGTLINLFYDFRFNSWEIATKTAVGGDYWFYRTNYVLPTNEYATNNNHLNQPTQLTFRDMFIEAFTQNDTEKCENDLNRIQCFDIFDKYNSYSFVLQHPQNHIILPISTPIVYLVGVYKLTSLNEVSYISPFDYEKWDCFTSLIASNIIKFPKNYNNYNLTYEEIIRLYGSSYSGYNSLIPSTIGLLFTNTTNGIRTVVMNPIYDSIKELRGNNPNLQYNYFNLMKTQNITLFLTYFPVYKSLFKYFNNEYNKLITNVHQCYYKHYVLKNYEKKISSVYRTHIYKIHHQIFIPSNTLLNKIVITRKIVKTYFDNLEPKELLYTVNQPVIL